MLLCFSKIPIPTLDQLIALHRDQLIAYLLSLLLCLELISSNPRLPRRTGKILVKKFGLLAFFSQHGVIVLSLLCMCSWIIGRWERIQSCTFGDFSLCKIDSYVAHMFYSWSFGDNIEVPIAINKNKYFLSLNTSTTVFDHGASNSNKNRT